MIEVVNTTASFRAFVKENPEIICTEHLEAFSIMQNEEIVETLLLSMN